MNIWNQPDAEISRRWLLEATKQRSNKAVCKVQQSCKIAIKEEKGGESANKSSYIKLRN